ncbi:hypothetical protein [Botrimarina mediterranea]|uniref:Uncharacterized protein n=1 Tax=Botrimarina mediterranea TaxID=2528022 RepID=A0A518K703_9BACT|nr:hypothetical protein [Botrimarina mediterranea]QDV73582.1 hypothetical protein Spa11_17800 [Botrimarina mediterranea]QDV78173.1 hypothetical protein K2D_17790 [Planctomycetes bacterium K2D]
MFWILFCIAVVAALVALAFGWLVLGVRRARKSQRTSAIALAAFHRDRAELAESFRVAAEATGKPRGLAWKRCELADGAPLVAIDKATGELVALVGVTISFAAIPGGGMEEVEAVGDLRDATAVFHWREGCWQTEGRAVFNHSPEQTLKRYRQSLTPHLP